MIMVSSVLNLFKRHLGQAMLAITLLFSSFANSQAGNVIPGYTYLGTFMVDAQPHYYYLSTAGAFWPVAKANANLLGGYLATLTTAAENNQVTTWVVGVTGYAP